jgi:hypothetical protein
MDIGQAEDSSAPGGNYEAEHLRQREFGPPIDIFKALRPLRPRGIGQDVGLRRQS